MANSLKILSWNIQKFGEEKLNDPNIISYICGIIKLSSADIVGLMELVGWQGNETRDKLVTHLNNLELLNKTGVTWVGEASEMTPSRPNEQYLFLWNTSKFKAKRWLLWNVIGETSFDDFFKKYKVSAAKQEDFWKSMFKNGVLDAAYQLKWKVFDDLVKDYKKLDLTKKEPKYALTDPQKKDITDLLIAETPETFPVRGSRPPFLLMGQALPGNEDLAFMVFHAPGPGDALPIIASNQLPFVKPLQDYKVCVVMGDFNVDSNDCGKKWALQYFDQDAGKLAYVSDAKGVKLSAYPFQRLTGPAINPAAKVAALSGVLDYGKRLWSSKTSMTTLLAADTVVADAAAVQGLLSSEYDKFFVRAPKADPTNAYVFLAFDAMLPKQITLPGPVLKTTSTTATTYSADLASWGKQAFDKWWDHQNAKKRKSDAVKKMLTDMPKLTAGVPQNLREAQYVYRSAISDHLPIVMEVQYA